MTLVSLRSFYFAASCGAWTPKENILDTSGFPRFMDDMVEAVRPRTRGLRSTTAARAKPMLWWYEPMYPGLLMAPAIDCHTDGIPKLDARVEMDHWVIAGSLCEQDGLQPVYYTQALSQCRFLAPTLRDWQAVPGHIEERRLHRKEFRDQPRDALSSARHRSWHTPGVFYTGLCRVVHFHL